MADAEKLNWVGCRTGLSSIVTLGRFVRFSHTVFSLPLVLAGLLLGAGGWPERNVILLALLAAAGARTTAMALNRIIDRKLDARNQRTAQRELPRGALSLGQAWAVASAGAALYVASAAALGPLLLALSPLPLAVFLGYPYLKRWTPLCHFGVGLGLGLAPLAGWIAVRQSFSGWELVLPLGIFGVCWVAGFDIIYATLDEEFDRTHRVHSLPADLGRHGALRVSGLLHVLAFLSLVVLWGVQEWSPASLAPLAAAGVLLLAEQRLAHRVELAFFRINLVVGFAVLAFVVVGVFG